METNQVYKIHASGSGKLIEIAVSPEDYMAASKAGLTLTQHLNIKHGHQTDLATYGDVMSQCMASAGMFLGTDLKTGIKAPSMDAIAANSIDLSAITRNDGSNQTPGGRMLFPEIILRTIEAELRESNDYFLRTWDSMVAITETVTGPKFEQPIIHVKAPEASESGQIAQLAEPDAMVSITTSDVTRRIPTKSIGLLISDEAQQATTLDLVNLSMSAQARGEHIRMVEGHMKAIFNGDVDAGEAALTSRTAQSIDGSISAAGTLSQKAWIKYLWEGYRTRNVTNIVCDLDTAFAIEGRSGKPNVQGDDPRSPRMDVLPKIDHLSDFAPTVMMLDSAIVGANTLIGLDNRFAIRRVINVTAAYSAIEQYVMRKATAFRVDYGEVAHKLYPESFDKLTLTV